MNVKNSPNTNQKNTSELKGTIKEMVQQFLEMCKNNHLTVEEMESITPSIKEFFTTLNSSIQKQIEEDTNCHTKTIEVLGNALNEVAKGLTSTDLSVEEKRMLCEQIHELNASIKEIEFKRQENSQKFKYFLSGCGTVVMLALTIMFGNKSNNS